MLGAALFPRAAHRPLTKSHTLPPADLVVGRAPRSPPSPVLMRSTLGRLHWSFKEPHSALGPWIGRTSLDQTMLPGIIASTRAHSWLLSKRVFLLLGRISVNEIDSHDQDEMTISDGTHIAVGVRDLKK